MLFRWLRSRKRRQFMAMPMPPAWESYIADEFVHWRWLTPGEKTRLGGITHAMVRTKHWAGCQGLALTDPMKALIAAQAGLLLLGGKRTYFGNVTSVLVYPGPYVLPGRGVRKDGQLDTDRAVLGHACSRGPVVLSWPDVLVGARDALDGRNLVFHEFAHKLDMLDGWIDGTPPLACRDKSREWVATMTPVFEALQRDVARGRRTFLNAYAATSPAEFFAVTTEFFFERPEKLAETHPAVYQALATFYLQDPAARLAAYRTRKPKRKTRRRRARR